MIPLSLIELDLPAAIDRLVRLVSRDHLGVRLE
jgi:hypothetical protein